MKVVKRDGSREPLNIEKLHKVVAFACEGINGVSESQVEMRAHLSFYDGIKTRDIQESLIRAAADLIEEGQSNYQYVAGRLSAYHIRKDAYNSFNPPHIYGHIKNLVDMGLYEHMLLEWYSEEEWNDLNGSIQHELDEDMTFASMEIFRTKYLVRNRAADNERMLESPQFAFMLIAATMHHAEKEDRIQKVIAFYKSISRHDFSLPTPIMAGMRTSTRQFSSCTLIECHDSLDSIAATATSIIKYISKRAGIGLGVGRIRSVGSKVGSGLVTHTGLVPFLKVFQAAVRSCNQGGVRVGAATVNYPIWHAEIENLLPLKDNRGTEDTRLRHMDFCVQFSRLFYQRLVEGKDISLFNPNDVPDMYDAFFENEDKFSELYHKYELEGKATEKVNVSDLFVDFMNQRKSTGRIYVFNADNVNSHGSFFPEKAPIKMTNLCVEITLPTNAADGRPGIVYNEGVDIIGHDAYAKWRKENPNQPLPLVWEIE